MWNHSTPTRDFPILPTLFAACVLLGSASVLRADCTSKSYDMPLADQTALLRLGDGQHKIGSVVTGHGTIEARVAVKDRVVAAPRFFLEGKLLSEVSEAALPEGLRDCLKKAAAAGPTLESSVARLTRAVRDWIVAPAYAEPAIAPRRDHTVLTELCFKGTSSQQVCTYKACTSYGFTGKTTCVVLFVTGA